jgi:hypothetical protein
MIKILRVTKTWVLRQQSDQQIGEGKLSFLIVDSMKRGVPVSGR